MIINELITSLTKLNQIKISKGLGHGRMRIAGILQYLIVYKPLFMAR